MEKIKVINRLMVTSNGNNCEDIFLKGTRMVL